MKNKKSVLISTFNNSKNNYGAVLQSYALSEFIKNLEYDVTFLTLRKRTNHILPNRKKSIILILKQIASKILSFPTKKRRNSRTKEFERFTTQTQKQIVYENYEELLKNPPVFDIYLSGSDQVWNPKTIHDELFCSFVGEQDILVSYAASMGSELIPESNQAVFEKYIARYNSISVREDTMIDIIKQYTSLPITQNIDPVFLLSPQKWLQLAKPYKKLKYKKYILLYLIEWKKQDVKQLLTLKKQTGLPLVLITLSGLQRKFADQIVMDASPEEFLFLIANAEMVVSSSFHGTAFSIVFNKPFIAFPGKDKPTRIESTLRHFHLENHITPDIRFDNFYCNFEEINKQIQIDQENSRNYLINAFSCKE